MDKKLSIIVCAYNSEKTIKKTIDSLLDQTEAIKIIIIDDGSKDNTAKIAKEYSDMYPDISYYYKENGGIADARNFGMDKVDTEYFGFLDSDDTCKKDMAMKMLEAIEKDEADVAICDFSKIFKDKTIYQKDTGFKDKKDMIARAFAIVWNKIYKTSFIRDIGIRFNKGLRYEDICFSYELFPYLNKVAYVEESLIDYYQNEGSQSREYSLEVLDLLEDLKLLKTYYKDNGLLAKYSDELEYINIRLILGSGYLRAIRIGDKEARKGVLDKGWEYFNREYPNFKDNPYLKEGLKNKYYGHINRFIYDHSGWLFRIAYKLGLMR